MHLSAIFLFVLSCTGAIYGYSKLRRQIPNGYKVPHPCTPGTTWHAVGHMAPEYDPTKNAFGKDVHEVLEDSQLEWAKVCSQDSDGDGLTNGQELGDPSCMWKVSDGLQGLADPTGHPGICEPGRKQCTSGITFNECPNPFASGSSEPSISVPQWP
ncbi:temptin-like [Dreissena polymorpha]|uniref:Temptin Cys/Cys disulfide domain-containing protein n=1 Tax=Dreissena polymorpha TaxID=45954 RepID=A0A9D4LQM1_DREPO|nr:temptin-like [Dreissena polymorpha]KAH3862002.1 hypothetical protein DPMN_024956 [Dreissena polymorpha]